MLKIIDKAYTDILSQDLLSGLGIVPDQAEYEVLKGGNNRIFKIRDAEKSLVLKHYFDDDRMRLEKEYSFIEYAWESNAVNIPMPLFCDKDKNIACYSFIQGRKLFSHEITRDHMDQVCAFIKQINGESNRFSENGFSLQKASEACFSFDDHLRAVDKRIARFQSGFGNDDIDIKAENFIQQTLIPCWEKARDKVEKKAAWTRKPGSDQTIISPSDFGFHNILLNEENNQLYFIDFEYAGWDDPIKMVCDFFCQVEVPVPSRFWDDFILSVMDLVPADTGLLSRVGMLMPIYRVKWCCIILNDFINTETQRKKFASFDADHREKQLSKALSYAQKYLLNP